MCYNKAIKTDAESASLKHAYAHYTFGAGAKEIMLHTAFTDWNLQQKYHAVCALLNPELTIPEQIHARMTRWAETTDLIGAKNPQMIQKILYEMTKAYGFDGPHDERTLIVDKTVACPKRRCLVDQMKELTNGRGVSSANADPMRAVAVYLRQYWHITPHAEGRSNRYSLKGCEPKWTKPCWEDYVRNVNFMSKMKECP